MLKVYLRGGAFASSPAWLHSQASWMRQANCAACKNVLPGVLIAVYPDIQIRLIIQQFIFRKEYRYLPPGRFRAV